MMDKLEVNLETTSETDIEHYKQLLDQSSHHLTPAIHAQLDEKRRHAVALLGANKNDKIAKWRPAFALTIAMLIVAVVMIYPQTSEQPVATTDIYADLELLMDEEQLDFLAYMEVSEWVVSANDG